MGYVQDVEKAIQSLPTGTKEQPINSEHFSTVNTVQSAGDYPARGVKQLDCFSGFLKWAIISGLIGVVGIVGLMIGLHMSGNLTTQQKPNPNDAVTAFQSGNKVNKILDSPAKSVVTPPPLVARTSPVVTGQPPTTTSQTLPPTVKTTVLSKTSPSRSPLLDRRPIVQPEHVMAAVLASSDPVMDGLSDVEEAMLDMPSDVFNEASETANEVIGDVFDQTNDALGETIDSLDIAEPLADVADVVSDVSKDINDVMDSPEVFDTSSSNGDLSDMTDEVGDELKDFLENSFGDEIGDMIEIDGDEPTVEVSDEVGDVFEKPENSEISEVFDISDNEGDLSDITDDAGDDLKEFLENSFGDEIGDLIEINEDTDDNSHEIEYGLEVPENVDVFDNSDRNEYFEDITDDVGDNMNDLYKNSFGDDIKDFNDIDKDGTVDSISDEIEDITENLEIPDSNDELTDLNDGGDLKEFLEDSFGNDVTDMIGDVTDDIIDKDIINDSTDEDFDDSDDRISDMVNADFETNISKDNNLVGDNDYGLEATEDEDDDNEDEENKSGISEVFDNARQDISKFVQDSQRGEDFIGDGIGSALVNFRNGLKDIADKLKENSDFGDVDLGGGGDSIFGDMGDVLDSFTNREFSLDEGNIELGNFQDNIGEIGDAFSKLDSGFNDFGEGISNIGEEFQIPNLELGEIEGLDLLADIGEGFGEGSNVFGNIDESVGSLNEAFDNTGSMFSDIFDSRDSLGWMLMGSAPGKQQRQQHNQPRDRVYQQRGNLNDQNLWISLRDNQRFNPQINSHRNPVEADFGGE